MIARLAIQAGCDGPRPLNPVRDLDAVADLLEAVFKRDLGVGGRRMIRKARAMSKTGPLVYLLSHLSEARGGLSPGLVWEQNGQIVGNVTLMRSNRQPGAWQMANVAVHPDHRHRGIATRLLKAAVEHISQRNGRAISLQVRQNHPAVALYRQLGFQSLGAVTRWRLDGRWQLDQILTTGRSLRRARRSDWAAIWRLFHSVTPAAHGWPDPRQEKDFRPNFWRGVADFIDGQVTHRWVRPSTTGAGLDGYAELCTRPGSYHRLTLRTRPAVSGELEGDLLQMALRHIWPPGTNRVLVDHPAGDAPAEGRLREAGFRPLRTLVLMKLILAKADK